MKPADVTCDGCGMTLGELEPSPFMRDHIARVYADDGGRLQACPECTDAETVSQAIAHHTRRPEP